MAYDLDGLDFAELFAFCDLHASRWHLRRQGVWTSLAERLMTPRCYDRQGFPIPGTDGDPHSAFLNWARLLEAESNRVAWDELPDGSLLSTVWLGLDHAMGLGRPVLFETMRFRAEPHVIHVGTQDIEARETLDFPDPETGEDTSQLRYATEEEALAAHHEILRRFRIREGH